MNIFEALDTGIYKARLPGMPMRYAYMNQKMNICWDNDILVELKDLRRNDWLPYVPPEERKIEGLVNINYNYVPRETPCVCENIQSGGRVEVDFNQKCIKCGKQFNFVLAKIKAKRTEVFKNVKWKAWADSSIYPCIDIDKKYSFLDKPPMKMTLEWEE